MTWKNYLPLFQIRIVFKKISILKRVSSGPIQRFWNIQPKMLPGRNFLYYSVICHISQISLVPRELQLVAIEGEPGILGTMELWKIVGKGNSWNYARIEIGEERMIWDCINQWWNKRSCRFFVNTGIFDLLEQTVIFSFSLHCSSCDR